MGHCPGRDHGDPARDLSVVRSWGAAGLLTLLQEAEVTGAGLAAAVAGSGLRWWRAPIPDMQPPGATFLTAWAEAAPMLLAEWRGGGRVLVHCAAGLGRTGTFAAALLRSLGIAPDAAIALVRATRPGAIETPEQLAFIHHGPSLLPG
jgi:protein-tyrosine phosphatase